MEPRPQVIILNGIGSVGKSSTARALQAITLPDGQRRTLQRRLKEWRRDLAHKLVFGVEAAGETAAKSSGPVHVEACL